ncbi:hypothetical protein C5Y96_08630 [Blastopirellula marina]|uniref:DUF4340 domain-containing protein n=1 Tax=Blastopirellula marina TaxID=124 RepID=A0A2S8FUH6_9BACT|nr:MULTISPECIES: hypothetical protein [Pirellulaceae]PQO35710.1 hypothetical protein C5Y96_08630 [Blastopirellula marina]RCS53284.1 hypothetical protein DTL36_08640 [Bremerella cremea]
MNARFLRNAFILFVVLGGVFLYGLIRPFDRDDQVQIGDRTVTSHRAKVVEGGKEDTRNVVVRPSPEFLIEYAFGDGLQGFNILRVKADGTGEYSYWDQASDSSRQKTLTFELSPGELEEICGKLNQSRFMTLANEYHGDVTNGTQIAITVVTGHVEKEVFCDNHFPVAVVTVADYLEKEVIQPNRNNS